MKTKKSTSSSSLSNKASDVFGDLGAVERLNKDLKGSVKTLNRDEVRTLVDYYYIIQGNRTAANNQIKQLEKNGEPHALLLYTAKQAEVLENQIKNAMDLWTEEHGVAKVIKDEIVGVGPVISAALVAYFDIHRAKTAGAFWRYAGLDPSSKWISREKVSEWVKENRNVPVDDLVFRAAAFFGRSPDTLRRLATTDIKGRPVNLTYDSLARAISKRPYNASLKVLCWKIGDCFMKFSNKAEKQCPNCGAAHKCRLSSESDIPDEDNEENDGDSCKECGYGLKSTPAIPTCFYGQIYRKQKQYLLGLNEAGSLAKTAADTLSRKNIREPKTLALYKSGKLSNGHIEGMAKRFAVKLFLSNLHELWCAMENIPCPQPYSMAILGHAHYICQPEIKEYIDLAKAARKPSV